MKNEKSYKKIKDTSMVKVTQMGHIVEIQYMKKQNRKASIIKKNGDEYVVVGTGEIKEFDKSDNRGDNENSLRQTFKRLRYLINNNFVGADNELFCTLTYKENMTCNEQLYKDFDKFIKRLRYRYKDVSKIEYISVVEPQGRGAWHSHLLLRFDDLDKVYIKNEDLRNIWGHGFVNVRRIDNIDNIGAYLTAYLCDLEINDDALKNTDIIKDILSHDRELVHKNVQGKNKQFVKGGRLHLYPPGMNIYRTSRGIKKPDSVEMSFKEAKKIVGSHKPNYSKTYHIQSDDFKNTITFLQYNLKR